MVRLVSEVPLGVPTVGTSGAIVLTSKMGNSPLNKIIINPKPANCLVSTEELQEVEYNINPVRK